MQIMRERMDFMMNALRGWVSNDLNELVHRTDSPFIALVTSFPLVPKFCVAEEVMCQAFPTTLKGPTRLWFSRLTHNSIGTLKELSAQFALHFIGGHRYKKSTACLMSIKQREDETLRSYITRFNKEAFSIDEANDKIIVDVFTNGLRKGKFLFSLYKNDLKIMSDVLYQATEYMNVEDALLA
ncbi:uncharacterized protein LOC112024786 [Quercus suber]|uniref:uncharacterized protein LOC112024786 n=1 Tax=Quercus suber TaxID=58331 RepID=UPI000CE23D37|nr:uncharacterized protein LOC112024786 [Quercus suber]